MRSPIPRYKEPVVKKVSCQRLDPESLQKRKEVVKHLERQCILELVSEKAKQMKNTDDGNKRETLRRWHDVEEALSASSISSTTDSREYYLDSDASLRSRLRSHCNEFVRDGTRTPGKSSSSEDSTEYTYIQEDGSQLSQITEKSKARQSSKFYNRSSIFRGKYHVETSNPEVTWSSEVRRLDSVVSELKHSYNSDHTTTNDLAVEVGSTKQYRGRRKSSLMAKTRHYFEFKDKTSQEIQFHWPCSSKIKAKRDSTSPMRRFSNWATRSDIKSLAVDLDSLKDLFKFQVTDCPAVTSLTIGIKEMLCVPNEIPRCPPEQKERACLYRQILYDQMNYERKDKGNYLLSRDSSFRKRSDKSPVDLWFASSAIPPDLIDTSALLKPLMLEYPTVAENFASWIIETPEARAPTYLVKSGLMSSVTAKMNECRMFPTKSQSRKAREARRRAICKVIIEDKLFFRCVPRLSEILKQIPDMV